MVLYLGLGNKLISYILNLSRIVYIIEAYPFDWFEKFWQPLLHLETMPGLLLSDFSIYHEVSSWIIFVIQSM